MTIKAYWIPRFSVFRVKGSRSVKKTKNCKLECCGSCTFCNRAIIKERSRSLQFKAKNKTCERCSLCKLLSFCPSCQQWPSCQKSTCGGLSVKVFVSLAIPGFKFEGSVHIERRVCSTLQSETPLTRPPVIVSGYANPAKSKHLKQASQSPTISAGPF